MAKIILIDDEPEVRHLMEQVLTGAGHVVRGAGDGDEGLRLMRADQPDLLITDLLMPNKEGIETIREVRREVPRLPILVISGTANAALYLEVATLLGAQVSLAKPFRSAELLRTVDALLLRGVGPAPLTPPPPHAAWVRPG